MSEHLEKRKVRVSEDAVPPPTVTDPAAAEIVTRLLLAHRTPLSGNSPETVGSFITHRERDEFLRAVLDDSRRDAEIIIEALIGRGIRSQRVLLTLVSDTARRLGDLWSRDDATFAEVTLGLCTLHRLVRERDWRSDGASSRDAGRTIALTALPGEQHLFGVTVVAEIFRDCGWHAAPLTGLSEVSVLQQLASESFDVLGISVTHSDNTDAARRFVSSCRAASRNKNIVVFGGGPMFAQCHSFAGAIGVDTWVPDAESAPAVVGRLCEHEMTSN